MIVSEILKEIEEASAEAKKLNEELNINQEKLFDLMTKAFKLANASYPNIFKAVTWVQSAPIFNDGDPCVFSVKELEILSSQFDLRSSFYELSIDEKSREAENILNQLNSEKDIPGYCYSSIWEGSNLQEILYHLSEYQENKSALVTEVLSLQTAITNAWRSITSEYLQSRFGDEQVVRIEVKYAELEINNSYYDGDY